MPETFGHVRYSEGRRGLIFLPFALGAVISTLLFSFQVPYLAANRGIDAGPINLEEKCRNGKPLFSGSSGTTFIYSFQPWGGVRFDNPEKPIPMKRDVYIRTLLWEWNDYPLSKAETFTVMAESELRMMTTASRPTVQFLRIRNPSWMTTF